MKKYLLFIFILCQISSFGQGFFWTYSGNVTPAVTTQSVTAITGTTATGNGTVVRIGSPAISVRGSCWNTSTDPTTANSKTTDGSTVGAFTSALTLLTFGTTYYVRAYVTNSVSSYYGENVTFVSGTTPTVTTTAVSYIDETTATSGGNVTSDGGGTVTDRGVCWNTSTNPTTSDSHTHNSTGTGAFTSSLTGLTGNTTYYVRAYAINGLGTVYGENSSFTTDPSTTDYGYLYNYYAAVDAKDMAASGWRVAVMNDYKNLMRYLDSDGAFNNNTAGGYVKATGTTYWTTPNTGANNSSGWNGRGTGYRQGTSSALFVLQKDYGYWWATGYPGTAYSVARLSYNDSIFIVPVSGGGSIGLGYNHGASVRLISTSTCSTHGETGTYTGNDGKTYATICIGTQRWLAENLRETLYRDATEIPKVTDATTWIGLSTGARCLYP